MSGWEVRFSNSRQLPYFFNTETQKSVWEPPAGLSDQQIQALPGAAKYLAKAGGDGQQAGPPGQVRASHILAKHNGSRRPSSWREANITRTLPESRQIIQAHINYLQSLPPAEMQQEFARIASTESDCSSAKKGGDLGWFGKGMMQRTFEEGTYALDVKQLSDVIESDSGVHVILRTG